MTLEHTSTRGYKQETKEHLMDKMSHELDHKNPGIAPAYYYHPPLAPSIKGKKYETKINKRNCEPNAGA